MAKVIWSAGAVDHLDRIVTYIAVFDSAAAYRMAQRLVALGNGLSDFPNRGRIGPNDTRELTTVPPYILQYDVDGERVSILSIRHGARQPTSD